MTRKPRFKAGDFVLKRHRVGVEEAGTVVERKSQRTGNYYLTVSITRGPRKGQTEFPERGWEIDEGNSCNERPSTEPEDYVGSEDWRTRHHSRAKDF